MKTSLLAALAACLLTSVSATRAETVFAPAFRAETVITPLAADARVEGAVMFGTLAPLGSFEFEAAPLYTRNAVLRHQAAVALQRRAITVAQAQAIQSHADAVRRLLDAAVTACAQSNRTGKCTKSPVTAHRLLKQANAILVRIQ